MRVGSTTDKKSPAITDANSSTKPEPIIEGRASSYCSWVTLAVAIIAVIGGVYLLKEERRGLEIFSLNKNDKIGSKLGTGLVFYWEVISLENIREPCEFNVGGKKQAEMLESQFKSLSEGTNNLFIIEEVTDGNIAQVEIFIKQCIKNLGINDYFVNIYVWESNPQLREDWKSKIEMVIKLTGLDSDKLYFICRKGYKSQRLKKSDYNVFEVKGVLLEESELQGIKMSLTSGQA